MEFWIRLFGFPVRINLLFFLVVGMLRPPGHGFDPLLLVAWVVLAAVAILAHEFGHAVMARRFGRRPAIALQALGGLTSWQGELTPGRRLLVSLAGPVVGIVIGLVALTLRRALGLPEDSAGDTLLDYAVWVNLGWALFNLVPMLPMDGGKVMASFLELLFGGSGWTVAYVVSIVLAALLAVLGIKVKAFFLVILCALFIWTNVEGLRSRRRRVDAVPAS